MLIQHGLGSRHPVIGTCTGRILLFIALLCERRPSLGDAGEGGLVGLLFAGKDVAFVFVGGEDGVGCVGGGGEAAGVGEVEGLWFGFSGEELFEELGHRDAFCFCLLTVNILMLAIFGADTRSVRAGQWDLAEEYGVSISIVVACAHKICEKCD